MINLDQFLDGNLISSLNSSEIFKLSTVNKLRMANIGITDTLEIDGDSFVLTLTEPSISDDISTLQNEEIETSEELSFPIMNTGEQEVADDASAVNLPISDSNSEQTTVRLKVTVQNLASEQGVFFSPFWLGFHDGSFDTFTVDESASLPLEIVAEDGIIGLEFTTPEFQAFFERAIAAGANLPAVEDTISSLFAAEEPDGIQAIAFADFLGFPPSSEYTFTVDVNPDTHTALSYASMAVPSNDGFVADIEPIPLFSSEGVFLPQEIEINGADVFDAGTEINDEDITNTPISEPPEVFFQAIRTGIPEDKTIQPHPLLLEPGLGGFLDLPRYVNADFTRAPSETLALISVELESEPEPEPLLTEVFGSLEADVIEVAGSNQLVFAGDLNDLVDATTGEGNNRIFLGSGDDTTILGSSDRILGAAGDDRFFATSGGDNVISGGAGADQFWVASAEIPNAANIITDFTAEEDVIGIAGLGIGYSDLTITDTDSGILVSTDRGNLALITDASLAAITVEDNFVFA